MTQRALQLARVQDRYSLPGAEPWVINPRTKFLETRAPITWTGVRPYTRPDGRVIRVLRRPEQVEAPKHLARLRSLPATLGHPSGDRDVTPETETELVVGYTGDELRVDVIEGYRCPTSRVVAKRATAIDAIERGQTQTSLGYTALWAEPCADERATDPTTGEPCGVWAGPHGPEYYDVEHILDPDCDLVQQLVREGFDADKIGANHFAIGLARGRGGRQSEIMRIVDSIDVIRSADSAVNRPVLRRRTATGWRDAATRTFDAINPDWSARQQEVEVFLASHTSAEDPSRWQTIPKCTITYGTNEYGVLETSFHFDGDPSPMVTVPAKPLDEITQEYIVDLYLWSRDPHDELVGPNGEELPECTPVATTDAEKWVCSTSTSLPIHPDTSTAWDGDAAAASVFAWAGFDADPPKPDAERARQAFLAYDTAAPDLRGSYKLPITRAIDGRLQVIKAGLDAAAGYLPKTNIPQSVAEEARKVLDLYYAKVHAKPVRDDRRTVMDPALLSTKRTPDMTTETIRTKFTLAPSRDLASWAAKHDVKLPAPLTLTVARDEVSPDDLMAFVAGLEEACAAMREKMGVMEGEMEDMGADKKALEEAVKAKEDELSQAQAALAQASDAMKKSCDGLTAERDALTVERDALLAEVAPLRTAELDRLRGIAVKAGVAKDAADKLASTADLRRAVVVARCPDKPALAKASDDVITHVFDVVASGLGPVKVPPKSSPMPEPTLVKPRDAEELGLNPDAPKRERVGSILHVLHGEPQPVNG